MVGGDQRLDLGDPGVGVHALALDLGEHLAGVVQPAGLDQVARGLGDDRGEHEVDRGRHDADAEHPLPGLQAEQMAAGLAAGGLRQQPVDQLGYRDAEHDRGLLEGGQPAPVLGRRDLGDVGRGDHRGDADGRAAEDAPEGEVPGGEGQHRADGADREQQRARLHDLDAAVPVGEPAGQRRADRRAQQGRGDDQAGHAVADAELLLDAGDGAVDHGAVVAEQEPAEGRGGGDEDDEAEAAGRGGLDRPGGLLGDAHDLTPGTQH